MREIRIPQGMRDLSPEEVQKKTYLKNIFMNLFNYSGFHPIETPAVEFFSTFDQAYNDVHSEEMYRFFDQNGRMMVLREDMTVPAARVCASKFANSQPPFRISYCADVFKVRHAFAGKRSEVTDCGIELIGLDESSDLEVLSLACDALSALGIPDWTLEIGNSRFFQKACEELHLEHSEKQLADLIDRKSMVDLQELLSELSLTEKQSSFFLQLPLLGGDNSILEEAEKISFTDELRLEVKKLSRIYQQLKSLNRSGHITFDFGKIPHLDYYTGIIFEGYVNSVSTSVLSGGRYDHLLAKFGRDLPACGFSIKLDYLMDSVPYRQKKTVKKLYYPHGQEVAALQKAEELRKEGPVELIPWNRDVMEVHV